MAILTPTQQIRTVTPPAASHGARGMWQFSVPLDRDQNHDPSAKAHSTYNDTHNHSRITSSQSNGTAVSSKLYENDAYASSKNSVPRGRQPDSSPATEFDSVVDLPQPKPQLRTSSLGNGHKAVRKASKKTSMNSIRRTPEQNDDGSPWIHRDKLAQIESQELEAAGFRVGRTASERRESSNVRRDEKRQRLASPVRIEGEAEDPSVYDYSVQDVVQDELSSSPSRSFIPKPSSQNGRNGTSRIPVPKSVSSSVSHSERDITLPGTRSRAGSTGWASNHNGDSPKSDSDKQNDSPNNGTHLASPPETPLNQNSFPGNALHVDNTSPTKLSKSPGKANPTSRKVSVNARGPAAAKSRSVTPAKATPDSKRPGTSGGLSARPSTSHRPEGEAPWIATMYKPDPRLPPDQQMLPTHAKRLAQEQWEKEGKTGTVYDRNFNLLNDEQLPQNPVVGGVGAEDDEKSNRNPGSQSLDPTFADFDSQLDPSKWSLAPDRPKSANSATAAGQRTSDHGRYSTMPNVAAQPPASPGYANQPQNIVRLPQEQEEKNDGKKKKEGGCCGCVVM